MKSHALPLLPRATIRSVVSSRSPYSPTSHRPFSSSTSRGADGKEVKALRGAAKTLQASSAPLSSKASDLSNLFPKKTSSRSSNTPADGDRGALSIISQIFSTDLKRPSRPSTPQKPSAPPPSATTANLGILDYDVAATNPSNFFLSKDQTPHHLHVYATKHNTHITLTKPNRDAIISLATGNLGFRKAARGSYDAAYQLTSFFLSRVQDRGLLAEIVRLELVLRGFGIGREAVTKALLGSEGRFLRNRFVRVTDATRLKFGGTRSKKPRRLG
ncbi:MAG: hypothetical protein M1817_001720 [Caeruleum heppii]|nr:MAG: hypothetical protein M1817_001720 [Caeruleum heppii]